MDSLSLAVCDAFHNTDVADVAFHFTFVPFPFLAQIIVGDDIVDDD